MRYFLDDYIQTLGETSRNRAAFILEESKLEKSKVDMLARKIEASSQFSSLVLPNEDPNSLIMSGRMVSDFTVTQGHLEELYAISNLISLLINSHTSVLSADIKTLDDELTALEKVIQNYAFLLADTKAYDYAFLEPFNDDTNRDTLDFPVPDRSGKSFSSLEEASVNSEEGVLSIAQVTKGSWPLSATVLQINAGDYSTSDTDISNTTNKNAGLGWRLAVSSPQPINSGIGDPDFAGYDRNGLQCIIEYSLESSSPVDTITIEPLANTPIEVLQIRVYRDLEETEYFDLINISSTDNGGDTNTDPNALSIETTKEMDKTKSYHFPLQSVAKFKVFVRARTYYRNGNRPITREESYRKVTDEVTQRRDKASDPTRGGGYYDRNGSMAQRQAILGHAQNRWERDLTNSIKKFNSPHRAALPRYRSRKEEWGTAGASTAALESKIFQSNTAVWNNSNATSTSFREMFLDVLDSEDIQNLLSAPRNVFNDRYDNGRDTLIPYNPGLLENTPPRNIPSDFSSSKIVNDYEYVIGLKSVRATADARNFRAVFVSTQLPSPGDCGEVKVKAKHDNFVYTNTSRDSDLVTSVEYSVTNIANPSNESDWLPILPVETTQVFGERFFPDASGKGFFRFPASTVATISLYKNGYLFEPVPLTDMQLRSQNRQSIIGVRLPTNSYTEQDIFTVDYTPSFDRTIVNFEDQEGVKFSDPPLVSAFDSEGAGEGFTGTNGQLAVPLLSRPFVDYNTLSTSAYVEDYGLSGNYSPVVVRFDDGTVAYNFTNYNGGEQSTLDPDAIAYQFIHNGKELLFNKAADKPFRVYYQYLPSNVRVRVVLRVNDKDFVSPKVDYYQLKAKTRKADVRKDA